MDFKTEGRLSRRRFLAVSGAAMAAGMTGAPAAARPGGDAFAVIADSHLDPYSPSHSANLEAVLAHVAPRAPEFVLHVGDVVEAGFPAEYAEWDRIVPAALARRVRAVPGNHETRWDEWAKDLYREQFGQTPYAFDAAGLHVVALDPTQLLQEPGFFAREQLAWLRRDLLRARRPSIVFVHYPVGGDNFYVGNQDALLDAIAGTEVRAVFAGHIHREEVAVQDGATLITLPAVLNTAAYHWARRTGDALVVERAQLTAGAWQVTPVAEVPLGGRAARSPVRRVAFRDGGVAVRLAHDAAPAAVRARIQPEAIFGGRSNAGWVELAGERSEWSGAVGVAGLAGGTHRLQVQVREPGGGQWDTVERVRLQGDERLEAAWALDLGAPVQAGLAALPGDRVAAATTEGRVVVVRDGKARWSLDARGPVHGAPLAGPDGERLFVSTARGRVLALDARDGDRVWAFDARRPALASPAWHDGAVLAAAGRALHALDARSGRSRWTADVGALVAGRPAADEASVYVGGGDGRAHAFDRATGERRWSQVIAVRESPYRTLIYGPWATQATLLPGNRVLVANVVAAYALDRATGAIAWQVAGGFMYNGALLLGDRLVLADERGNVLAVDPVSGAVLWRVTLPQRIIGGGPVRWGAHVGTVGVNGLVARLDPATGADAGRFRATVDYVHGAPAVAGRVLVTGGQDGVVRGVAA